MSLVAAIHVAVLFAIARSLGIGAAPAPEPERVLVTMEERVRPPDDTPPPPDYRVQTDYAPIPRPDDLPTLDFQDDVITGPPPDVPFGDDPPVIPPPQVQMVGVRPDPRHPLSKPEYSARMIREGNQGTIEVEVFVQPDGRVAEAKRNWRLLPATRDGVPVAQWHRLRVTFKLNER